MFGSWKRNRYWDYSLLGHGIMSCSRTVPTFTSKILEIGALGSSKLLVPIYQMCEHHISRECILSQRSPQPVHTSSFSNLSWSTSDHFKKWLSMKVDVSYMKTLNLTNKAFSIDIDYVLNDHCHWVTTQLQLINIIIIIIKVQYWWFNLV
jgi:hypothetical protein